MGLFKLKKAEKEEKLAVGAVFKQLSVATPTDNKISEINENHLSHVTVAVILRPRVTEKSTALSSDGRAVYVFEVSRFANRRDVLMSVKDLYKMTPEKVAIIKIPAKSGYSKGKMYNGKTRFKAYVYFKKGEKIEI